MSIAQRRLLYISFIILFFIITPAVSFYAAGYNFNINSGRLERTGILIVKTDPKDAQVGLGEKKKYNWLYKLFYSGKVLTTPLRLRNLLPDEYEIVISKDGYFDYYKKINLLPGQTQVLDNIILLKKSYPSLLVSENIIKTKISPDKAKLAAVSEKSIFIINLNNARVSEIPLKAKLPLNTDLNFYWSANSRKMLLAFGDFSVYDVDSGRLEASLKSYLPAGAKIVRWDGASDDKITALSNNTLWELTLSKKSIRLIELKNSAQAAISDFLFKDNTLFVIENKGFSANINLYNLKYEVVKSVSMPSSNGYEFINEYENEIYAHDKNHGILYIIKPWSLLPISDVVHNARETLVQGNFILYWNDFELWIYDSQEKSKYLLTRISKKINKGAAAGNYAIYNTSEGVNTIELGKKSYFNMNQILNWKETEDIVINPNSDLIYFTSWFGQNRALYSLKLK